MTDTSLSVQPSTHHLHHVSRTTLYAFLAVLVCLLGWGLFLHNIDVESLWFDEWVTWEYSRAGLVGAAQETAWDVHPPFYYQVMYLWMRWTHSSDVLVMRVSSAVFAVLSIALTYRLGLRWFDDHRAALAAAAFLATSSFTIYYARELRMYTLIVLLAVASWWFWQRHVDGQRGAWPGYAATVSLMIYTYYFTGFVVVVQAVAALIFYTKRLPRLIAAYIVAGVAFLPWLPTFLRQLQLESQRSGGDGSLSLDSVGKFVATSQTSPETIRAFVSTYTAGQPAFVLLLVGLAFVSGWRLRDKRRPLLLVAGWFFGTVALFFLVNLRVPVYNPRYVLTVMPALALLVGWGVALLPAHAGRLALVGVVVFGLTTVTASFREPKTPHAELLGTVETGFEPGDRVWYNLSAGALGSSLFNSAPEYYLDNVLTKMTSDDFIWDAPNDLDDPREVQRVWDVRPYWLTVPEVAQIPLYNGRYEVVRYDFGEYTVRLYEAPPIDTEPLHFVDSGTPVLGALPGETQPTIAAPGQIVTVVTWWQAIDTLERDYSISLRLHNAGEYGDPLLQLDGGLVIAESPTSAWTPDTGYRPLLTEVTLPDALSPGDYEWHGVVYYWEDPQPLTESTGESQVVQLATLTVESE